jgi:hypothetical protein
VPAAGEDQGLRARLAPLVQLAEDTGAVVVPVVALGEETASRSLVEALLMPAERIPTKVGASGVPGIPGISGWLWGLPAVAGRTNTIHRTWISISMHWLLPTRPSVSCIVPVTRHTLCGAEAAKANTP